MIYTAACRFARRAALLFAHPAAIVLFPLLCTAYLVSGGSELGLTLVLSVLAISTTQLVLLAQNRESEATQKKLDALLHGTDADEGLAGIEKD